MRRHSERTENVNDFGTFNNFSIPLHYLRIKRYTNLFGALENLNQLIIIFYLMEDYENYRGFR